MLAGLRLAEQSGEAQQVDVSMLDTSIALMSSTYTATAASGKLPPKMGNGAASGIPWATAFDAADDTMIMLAPNRPHQTLKLRDFVGLGEEPQFQDFRECVRHSDEFVARLAEKFLARPAEEWERELTEADVPCAHLQSWQSAVFLAG